MIVTMATRLKASGAQSLTEGRMMAITFNSSDPRSLLAAFKKAIDGRHVVTWSYDKDGDFTHTTEQWRKKAWLRPKIGNSELRFGIVKPKNQSISWEIYAIYQGRFIESVTAHLHDRFAYSFATARPVADDLV
jgi:hypothetical protein